MIPLQPEPIESMCARFPLAIRDVMTCATDGRLLDCRDRSGANEVISVTGAPLYEWSPTRTPRQWRMFIRSRLRLLASRSPSTCLAQLARLSPLKDCYC